MVWGAPLALVGSEEVALGGDDCLGPQEPLVEDPLGETKPCRRCTCHSLAATEAPRAWCEWYGGKDPGEGDAQEDILSQALQDSDI